MVTLVAEHCIIIPNGTAGFEPVTPRHLIKHFIPCTTGNPNSSSFQCIGPSLTLPIRKLENVKVPETFSLELNTVPQILRSAFSDFLCNYYFLKAAIPAIQSLIQLLPFLVTKSLFSLYTMWKHMLVGRVSNSVRCIKVHCPNGSTLLVSSWDQAGIKLTIPASFICILTN